jgi:calcineurin-like phosphoesterase
MTGARGGVIGVVKEESMEHLRTQMPVRYNAATDDPWLNAVVIRASAPGRADSIEPVLRAAPGA